jgi:hypothetical protein
MWYAFLYGVRVFQQEKEWVAMASEPPLPDYAQIAKASDTERNAVTYSLETWQKMVVANWQKAADYWHSEEGQQEQQLIDGLGLDLRLDDFQEKDALAFYQRYLIATTVAEREEEIKAFLAALCSQIKHTTLPATARLLGVSLLANCFGDNAHPLIVEALRAQIRAIRENKQGEKEEEEKEEQEEEEEEITPMAAALADPIVVAPPAEEKQSDETLLHLGTDKQTGHPIQISQVELCRGCYILGVQGYGKTSLLEQVVYEQSKQNKALIVLAVHSGFLTNIISRLPQSILDTRKISLLDLTDIDFPFSFNLCDSSARLAVIEP